jgi:hypothetical protein
MPPTRLTRAKTYILAHPDESKKQQALGAEVSEAMIAIARRELVSEGKLEPGRTTAIDKRPKPASAPALAPPAPPSGMLDHAAMVQIANIEAMLADDADPELISKAMLKQAIRFAFDPNLHADTRMSAQTLWGKLSDRQREKQLGPQAPISFEAGARRLADLMLACGPKMTTNALHLAFEVRDEGEVPSQSSETTSDMSGATPAP